MAVALAGCPPPCRQLCRKLDRCGVEPGTTISECLVSCDTLLTEARDADDKEGLREFNDHRFCLGSSTCDEIADGVCHDSELYPFSEG